MKYLVLIVFGAGLCVGSSYYIHRSRTQQVSANSEPGRVQPAAIAEPQSTATAAAVPIETQPPQAVQAPPQPPSPVAAPIAKTQLEKATLARDVDLLVSPQASHAHKRAVWAQLKASGSLDQAIRELEDRTANNPTSPDCASALGQAYLQKCGTITDVREQGILAMQADKIFDTALALDPANWEARFTKAVALSYWPASMNKGDEVVQHFQTLIQQQETQPPQPQFAETYVWLGDQYQKAGRADDARAVWERGATLFPDQQNLKNRLAASP